MTPMRRLLILAALLAAGSAGAATYYARQDGNDTTCNGTADASSASAPNCAELTINACADDITTAGDTCIVDSGTWTNPGTISVAGSVDCGTGAGVCTIRAKTLPTDITDNSTYGTRLDWLTTGTNLFAISGDNWVIQGFYVRAQQDGAVFFANSNTGFTVKDNRVEVKPGVGPNVFYTQDVDNVTVQHNWAHHYPGCIDDGQTYGSGPWGAGATASCPTPNGHCDFDDTDGSIFQINLTGMAASNVTITENNAGHWINTGRVHNSTNVTISRNRFTNCANHGCIEADDVEGVVVENNIAEGDLDSNCSGEPCNSTLFDSYCFDDVIIRNNTVVGHGYWWEQQLDALEPNPGADGRCTDNAGPDADPAQFSGGWYQHLRIYNNIVYDGDPASGAAGILMNYAYRTNDGSNVETTTPTSISDYNLVNLPAGGDHGIDDSFFYTAWSAWQNGTGHSPTLTHDAHGISSAPQFTSYCNTFGSTFPTCSTYTAASGSAPQVNAGVNSGTLPCPAVDYNGNTRNVGACDIGAYEYGAGAAASPNTVKGVTLKGAVLR